MLNVALKSLNSLLKMSSSAAQKKICFFADHCAELRRDGLVIDNERRHFRITDPLERERVCSGQVPPGRTYQCSMGMENNQVALSVSA